MENLIRLNKFIASNGYSSRRKIDELILQGRVTVNKTEVKELGFKIDPATDKVAVDGEYIKTSTKKIYIILNKPQGVITTVSDDKHRKTVIDLIGMKEKIFPVGRLDYNTTGLLLLTNDGELANKLMHPKSEIYKTYFVKLSKPLEEKHRLKLTEGIKLEGVETAPSKIRYPRKNNNYQDLFISIYEGRNRQVRNMFEHYGYFVRDLERTEYAGLKLGDLKQGEWRKLTAEEIVRLGELTADSPTTNKRVHYAKKTARRDYTKYKARDDRKDLKKDFKKPVRNYDRKDDRQGDRKPSGKNSKWGLKDKLVSERDSRLGFGKITSEDSGSDVKRDFKKFDSRDGKRDEKKPYKKFDSRDGKRDEKKPYKKFDSRDGKRDEKKPYKKFDSRDGERDEKKPYKKFDSRDGKRDEKKPFKKFDSRDGKRDEKKPYKKFDSRDGKRDEKKPYKKFDSRDGKRDEKKPYKKFDSRDTSSKGTKNFTKKDLKSSFKKRSR